MFIDVCEIFVKVCLLFNKQTLLNFCQSFRQKKRVTFASYSNNALFISQTVAIEALLFFPVALFHVTKLALT